jgi:NADH dehydrogenase (ubiquinone) flavoprotein 2
MSSQIFEQPIAFSFSADTLVSAKTHISKYPEGRQASAVMPLLDLAQRQSGGWLPRAAMDYVADFLDMPRIRAYEVATFYTMFNLEPVGKYHVQVCTNLPCWLRGSERIVETVKRNIGVEVGGTSEDALFTLSEMECLGACVNAPMMQVNDDYYEDLDETSTEHILAELRRDNKPKTGSQVKRQTCEPIGGLSSLLDDVGK